RADPDRYDLVITDLTMPNLTGDELARELLKLRPDLPVILTTGLGNSMNLDKARALGVRELVMKPATAQSWAEAAKRALNPAPPQQGRSDRDPLRVPSPLAEGGRGGVAARRK